MTNLAHWNVLVNGNTKRQNRAIKDENSKKIYKDEITDFSFDRSWKEDHEVVGS